MTRRIPILATIVVAGAVAIMMWLGFWQLQRAQWKDGLIARFQKAEELPPIAWPDAPLKDADLPLFRHATAVCLEPLGRRVSAGRNAAGETGYSVIVACRTGTKGPALNVELGWSRDPNARFAWGGGPVSGIIAPDGRTKMRLVAAGSPTGLERAAPPSIDQISNNHRSYAIQWFAFAAIAALIYALALRQRARKAAP